MLCARECPDWCIYIDSHKEEVAVPGAARARQRNVLDRFAIDFSLCMYCGICIEVCPFDALFWTPEFEYAEYDIRDLLHEKDRLGEWMATVPPPPAHDPNGEPAKEEAAARKAAAPTSRPRARAPSARRARRPAATAGQPGRPLGCGAEASRDGADVLLLALGAVAVGAGVLVVTTRHLVRAGLWLVVTLGAVAGLLPGAHRRAGGLGAGADLRRRGGGAAAVRGDADPGADRRQRRPRPAALAGRC